jgi:hypothetical protein
MLRPHEVPGGRRSLTRGAELRPHWSDARQFSGLLVGIGTTAVVIDLHRRVQMPAPAAVNRVAESRRLYHCGGYAPLFRGSLDG